MTTGYSSLSQNEARKQASQIRIETQKVIKSGKAKELLVKLGFVTKKGTLSKRYGG